jgi:hypothetical protein
MVSFLNREDAWELERKIAQASRLASMVGDQTTVGRLKGLIDELRGKLKRPRNGGRSQDEIGTRAHSQWEQNGWPEGRDPEFWLQAF